MDQLPPSLWTWDYRGPHGLCIYLLPLSFVDYFILHVTFAIAISFILFEFSFIDLTIGECKSTETMEVIPFFLAAVDRTVFVLFFDSVKDEFVFTIIVYYLRFKNISFI